MLDMILGGLSVVADVTTILRNLESQRSDDDIFRESLAGVEQRVSAVEREIASGAGEQRMLESYNALVSVLQRDPNYRDRLTFRRTDYGTRVVLLRRKIMVRDPHGEF